MTVFSTEGSKAGSDVRCDYCDNCGYHNPWDQQANDIVAGLAEYNFRKDLRDYFKHQSKDKQYIDNHIENFFKIVKTMIDKDFVIMSETISDAWREQVGEIDNAATLLMLSIVNFMNGDISNHNAYLKEFFKYGKSNIKLCQSVISNLKEIINIKPQNIYKDQFKNRVADDQIQSMKIFSSNYSEIFNEIETDIGLNLLEMENRKYETALSKYDRMQN